MMKIWSNLHRNMQQWKSDPRVLINEQYRILMQILSEARDEFADEWAVQQTRLMEKAAMYAVSNGSIKAESDILEHWTKG